MYSNYHKLVPKHPTHLAISVLKVNLIKKCRFVQKGRFVQAQPLGHRSYKRLRSV